MQAESKDCCGFYLLPGLPRATDSASESFSPPDSELLGWGRGEGNPDFTAVSAQCLAWGWADSGNSVDAD